MPLLKNSVLKIIQTKLKIYLFMRGQHFGDMKVMGYGEKQGVQKAQVEKMFRRQKDSPKHQTVYSAHGRIEIRTYQVITDLIFMDDAQQWNNRGSVVQITSDRYIKKTGTSSSETRYYISSLLANPDQINSVVRSHWGIENRLHWQLDVIFNAR